MYGALPTAIRGDYEFLGWYTAVDGGTKVTESDIVAVENDIILHAKWNYVGHSMLTIARIEPTCTEAGNIAHYKCTRCNKTFSDSAGATEVTNVTTAALGHSYDNTKTASVCQTCSDCGYTKSHSSWTKNAKSSTCRTCNTCSYKDTSHSYGSWTTSTSPTCQSTGSRYRTCGDCSYKQTETLSKANHSYTSGWCKTCYKSTGICKWCKRCYDQGHTSGNYTYSNNI